jgi:hypothetical protein
MASQPPSIIPENQFSGEIASTDPVHPQIMKISKILDIGRPPRIRASVRHGGASSVFGKTKN